MTNLPLSNVVARRGIRAVQLTYANRGEVVDLVAGRLLQHGKIDRSTMRVMTFSFEIELPNGRLMREGQWLILSPEGAVSILDDETFRMWFAIADHLEALSGVLTLPPADHVG